MSEIVKSAGFQPAHSPAKNDLMAVCPGHIPNPVHESRYKKSRPLLPGLYRNEDCFQPSRWFWDSTYIF